MRTLSLSILIVLLFACKQKNKNLKSAVSYKNKLEAIIGVEEYQRLMSLDLDGFDQSSEGFRKYSDNYSLTQYLIPEYITVNSLSIHEATNLHWHLGQIHAINDNYPDAIKEMELSRLEDSPVYWKCYVDGSIAFLERDKAKLEANIERLGQQAETMNIEVLYRLDENWESDYSSAYNGM